MRQEDISLEQRVYYTLQLAVWRLNQFSVSGLRARLYFLTVYGQEIVARSGGFGLNEKTKAVCGLARAKFRGLRDVRLPTIHVDPEQTRHDGCLSLIALISKHCLRSADDYFEPNFIVLM